MVVPIMLPSTSEPPGTSMRTALGVVAARAAAQLPSLTDVATQLLETMPSDTAHAASYVWSALGKAGVLGEWLYDAVVRVAGSAAAPAAEAMRAAHAAIQALPRTPRTRHHWTQALERLPATWHALTPG